MSAAWIARMSLDSMIIIRKIRAVSPLTVFVPLAGEDALAANGIEAATQAADSGKEIDEREKNLRRESGDTTGRLHAT